MDSVMNINNDYGNINCPETYHIRSRQVMPFLLDMHYKDIKRGVKPSVVINALKLTTEEVQEKLKNPLRKYKIGKKKDTFSRSPEAIIFQNFQQGVSYTATLTITNQKTVPKNLIICFESSRHFHLLMNSKKNHETRIAPGMSYTVYISFLPTDQMRDYVRDIRVVGDEDCFNIPVYAIGPRPLANMPDKIIFPPTLVKVQSTTTILYKNSGIVNLEAVHIPEKPFSCDIEKAIIPPQGFLEMKYYCNPVKTGLIKGLLKTYFKNELCMATELEIEVHSARTALETQSVTFEDVFMGLSGLNTLVLHNTSNYTFNFSWKMYDEQGEEEEYTKLIALMTEMRDYEGPRFAKLEFLDILDGEEHANIYKRILEDETKELLSNQNNKFLFNSAFFEIIPKVGRILPKSDFQFSVVFSPQQNIGYDCVAYLDIEGTEKRVRVSLHGYGIGPPVLLCVKKLNASQIYLTDKHQYELAVKNKGVIATTVTYQPKTTDWGGVIDCIPHSLRLGPDSTQAFIITYFSEVQGDFLETLDFIVEESQDQLQCTFTGSVVCPLLKCIPDAIDLGTISVGLLHTKEVWLLNDSRVSICYDIEIENSELKEILEISPVSGNVAPNSRIQVKVTFVCDVLCAWDAEITLIMWKSRQYTKAIPFLCTCASPTLVCTPEIIRIKFSFLNFEYFRTITLLNQTDLSGYVEYKPLQDTEGETIRCIPQQSKVYIKANETVEIVFKIVVTALGPHELPICLAVIGSEPQIFCTIHCNGQGPVVSYSPDEVNFGQIELLKESTQILRLVNDSPISAKIRVFCKDKSQFQIKNGDLQLGPEQTADIVVTAVFNSVGKIKDIINIEISDSDFFNIKVFGEGVGTAIVCDPPLFPKLDLGAILTYKKFMQEIRVINKGCFTHKLFFSKRPIVKSFKEEEGGQIPIFDIQPFYLELEVNRETKLKVTCFSKKPKISEEVYYCHALIGKAVQPQVIMKFSICAKFVDPHLDFSKTQFNFNVNVCGSEISGLTQDTLHFNNKTGVPLQVTVTVENSFTILTANDKSQYITEELEHNSEFVKEIEYCPSIKEKRKRKQRGRIIFEYENHPKTEIIQLYGEVMFPTVRLFPNIADFKCIPLGSTSYLTIALQNVSAMVVSFKWLWLEKSIEMNYINFEKENSTDNIDDNDIRPQKKFIDYVGVKSPAYTRDNENLLPTKASQENECSFYNIDEYLQEMRKVLFPILAPFRAKDKNELPNITRKPSDQHDVTKWFSLEPSEGVLQPNEYTLITIGFCPSPNTEVMATAVCKVFGGEEEELIVMGKSTKLSYKLDKNSVDFGNQVFCETCSSNLTITNDGVCSFKFKVVVEETLLKEAEMLDISPKTGIVASGTFIQFKIDYFPGFPGKFEKHFTLELGYLEPVQVRVHGYAVVSQVFLHVPRFDMGLSVEDCYKALAWITPEYLESVQTDDSNMKNDQPVDPTDFLDENGWTYISYNESYPSLMDINLAMERIVAFNHILKNRHVLKDHTGTKSKVPHIPNFSPPPYCVDFGFVIRDMPVCYTVLLNNYGPINAAVKLLEDNKSALLEKEFKIEFKNRILLPGETAELFVLFSPTSRRCKELNVPLEDVFRLSVSHGPIISVKLKAEVTLPLVSLNSDCLDFERVYCGDVLRRTKLITNNGTVPCRWFASIIKPNGKEGIPHFFVIPTEGYLEPGNKAYLNIYFAPQESHKIRRTLEIDMEGNTEKIFVNLFGEARETILQIAPTELKFPPTLSFFDNTNVFTIQNMSSIPVEIYFPTLDKIAEDEKLVTQIYLKYKNLKQVYIPYRAAGEKLPDFFTTTYMELVNKLRMKMIAAKVADDGISQSSSTLRKNSTKRSESEDPLAKFSPAELKSLLIEYINAEGFESEFSTRATTYQFEDSTDFIEIIEPELNVVAESIDRTGILLIFHGAPTTDYYKAANQVGIALSFPVYSIDALIIESLVESVLPGAEDILKKIKEKFTEVIGNDHYLQDKIEKEDNLYVKIVDMIITILTTKPKKGGKKSPTKEKSSKGSSEKSQGKVKEKTTDCFLNISPDQIIDLLRLKLKQFPYVIIESLHSTFLPLENLSLYTILKAAGAVQHIQLIILSYTVNDYIRTETSKVEVPNEINSHAISPKIGSEADPPSKNKSVKGDLEKKSKSSHPKKSKSPRDDTKKILQSLGKNMKADLDKFEELRREIVHISQNWDKRSGVLKKPYNEKSTAPAKKDTTTKDSSRTYKSSVKKQNTFGDDYEVSNSNEFGLYLWIILNSNRDRPIDFCEIIRNCAVADCDLQNAMDDVRKSVEPVFKESETVFSIVSKPSVRCNPFSSNFTIKDYIGKESSDTLRSRSKSGSADSKTRRRKSSRNSRRSSEYRSNVEWVEPVVPKSDKEVEFTTRAVLNPEECIKYQVTFTPVNTGKYSQSYILEDTKNQNSYKLICRAICEYPKIDFIPEVMFPKTLGTYIDKASYDHFVYIKDQKILDFGSVIVGTPKEKRVYSCDIVLRNQTRSTSEVTLSLSDDTFYVEPNKLVIPPKSEGKVKLCIKPTEIGTLTSEAFLSVKQNPKVEKFTLACTPCKFEFHILPKTIGFEKVPVSYKARRIVRMTNLSPINLRWEFVERDWNYGIFELSEYSGYIGLYSVSEIIFNFKPHEELFFPKKALQIRVFDVNSASDVPCYMDTITIHADSVEYNLEVENHIDFGDIKGGVDYRHNFPIINKGKCEVAMMFQLISNPLERTNFVREFFRITPQVLTIGAQKTQSISVIFHPTCNLSVENLFLFVVNMVESLQTGHIVKSYQVKVSATVVMPSYKLCPHSEVTFGYVQLSSSKKMIVELTNTGRFSFNFDLQSASKFFEAINKGAGKKSKKDKSSHNMERRSNKSDKSDKATTNKTNTNRSKASKGTQSSKKDSKKIKISKLAVDGFSMVPSSGTVNPNEKFEICVEFVPVEQKAYNQEIIVNIAEIEDVQKKKILTLKGFGCEPKINLRNFENVFIEQVMVTNLDEFVEPKNVENYCVFVSSEVALYFKLVCINTTKTIQLHFKNVGFVQANLTAKLDDFGKNVFAVSPSSQKLDPYSSCILEVTFNPDSLDIMKAILEISYNASADNKLVVQLFGQACLPQIKLLYPIPKNNVANLNFGPIDVDNVITEKMSFKNIGPIKCQVIVEIADYDKVFKIVPDSNTMKKLNVQIEEYMDEMKDHLLVNLLPEEVAEFEIIYKPIKQQSIIVFVHIHIIHNPFETNKIILNADSYDEDVIIDNLKALRDNSTALRNASTQSTKVGFSKNQIGYLIDFGHRQLNELSKLSFFIRNRSGINTFRFQFGQSSAIFIPEIGHLKPYACKEVLVVFRSSELISMEKEEIHCTVNRIQYVSPNENPLSWDDRQKFVYLDDSYPTNELMYSKLLKNSMSLHSSFFADTSGKRADSITAAGLSEMDSDSREVIEEGTEPEFTPLSNSSNIIPFFLTVAVDYCKYSCETNHICFMDTYIKEKSVQNFEVKNTGTVPLNIQWDIINKSTAHSMVRSYTSADMSSRRMAPLTSIRSISSTSLSSKEDSVTFCPISYPISIEPVKSVIECGQIGNFNVIFSPETTDGFMGLLRSTIHALDPNYEDMCIVINCDPQPRPFYIEYEDGHSASKDLVIWFESVGNGTECTRNVFIVNPHQKPISFEIMPEQRKEFSCFACETAKGKINRKKKAPISFRFSPHALGSFRAFFILKIPEKKVNTNILLEGVCRAPKVYFTETAVVMKATVPKVKTVTSLELVNDEIFPLSFKFNKKSQFDEEQQEKIEIYPAVGKLKPKSKSDIRDSLFKTLLCNMMFQNSGKKVRLILAKSVLGFKSQNTIGITFVTSNIVTTKFHVKCMIEKLKSPLILHVSASCIEVKPLVSYTGRSGKSICLNKDVANFIDLGHTFKGRKDIVLFKLLNQGQTGMFYAWKFDVKSAAHIFNISVDEDKGFLEKGGCATTSLQIDALRLGQLKQFKVNLEIMYGPTYTIYLNAISDKPIYSFPYHEYNFGYCFVQNEATKYYSTILSFKNLDANPIILENLFENTDYLTVDFTSSSVPPGNSQNIQILFHPQKVGVYQTNISFSLGDFVQTISISGEAVEMKLELSNAKDKFINFGEVLIDTSKRFKVYVVNDTPARMDVHFSLFENLVTFQKRTAKLDKINEMKMPVLLPSPEKVKNHKSDKGTDTKLDKQKANKKNSNKEKKQKELEQEAENQKSTIEVLRQQEEEERKHYLKSFTIIPNMVVNIPPHGKGYFEIIFQPNKRIAFEEKVYFEIQDHYEPLCIINGLGVAPEFSLDRTDLLFSGVITNSSQTQLITLKNTGDVIGSYNWIIMDKRHVFDIEPKQGFVMPNNDIKLKVTFSPKHEKCEYKIKVKCQIKEYKEPLHLLLKGNSVKIPEPKETVMFSCNVREETTQTVTLTNTSSETWLIYPEISIVLFSTPNEITALPLTDTQIQVTYSPKVMTLVRPDEGRMYIRMSNGGGLIYKLMGNAGRPAVKEKIVKEAYCKQNHYVPLLIENWLEDKQIFNVTTEVISPVTTKTLYKILGMKTIQLEGKKSKNYQWGVYLVNDVPIEFRVTFKNPETGEYEYYEIGVKVLPAQPLDTISIFTRVREPITKPLVLDNPIDVPVTFTLDCSERSLTFEKSLTLKPYTTTKVDLVYTPLRTEDITTVLNARCEELGLYSYSIKLQADSPKLENNVIIKAELGETAIKCVFIKKVYDRVVEFSHKFDSQEFYMEKCGPTAIGESSKILIAFEPSALGHWKSKLYLNSTVAGEYIYPLEGECVSPTAKGPFSVRLNYPTTIEFKNPFAEERKFIFEIQPDVFYSELKEDVIKSKKSTKILVNVQCLTDTIQSSSVTGKLTVYSPDEPDLEWTYYLLYNQS